MIWQFLFIIAKLCELIYIQKNFKNTNDKLLITDGEEFKLNQHQQNIIDINTTTKYQSCDEIKQMSLNLLNLNDIQLNLNKKPNNISFWAK